MKKIFPIIMMLFFYINTNAQKGNGGAYNIGHLYLKVIDSTTGKPMGDASVVLLSINFDTTTKTNKEILISGLTTQNNGDFSLIDLSIIGPKKLTITAVGFKTFEKVVNFNPAGGLNGIDMDLGNISLEPQAKELEAVVLQLDKPNMKLDIDKKVFYVDKNIVSAGGTALDVMKNVPSVQVSIDGSVKLRNAPPQIYLDGRPTTLTLDQIPADAIESVEVMTNPSAKYDASGGNAGILNIVLKKNRKQGYNGMVMTGVDSRGALTGMANFNVRQDKLNVTSTVYASQFNSKATGSTERLNLLSSPLVSVNQNNKNQTNGGFLFGRLGVDYFLNNRTTLSAAGIIVTGKFTPSENINFRTDTLFNTGKVSRFSNRESNSSTKFNSQGLQLGLKHNFQKAGKELTADFNFFHSNNPGSGLYTTSYFNSDGTVNGITAQQVQWGGNNKNITVQTDFVNPITDKIKVEAGLRAQLTDQETNYDQQISSGGGVFLPTPLSAGNFKNKNSVYAAYATFSQAINDFGYKVGVRAESSKYEGELLTTKEKFSNDYPVSLFPSIFLSQKLKNKQELQLSYTRRINRPGFNQILPFTNYTDSLNITRGNPDLKPEFTNSVEASYSKTFKKGNNLLFSIYYKQSNDLITRYLTKDINPFTGKDDIIASYINANSSYSTGAEITSINKLTKWWDITTNVNLYNSKINTDNVLGSSPDARWSWFGKFNSNFKLPKKFTAQLSVNYQSKTNLPVNTGGNVFDGGTQLQAAAQGYIRAYWATDIAIKKSFLKNDVGNATLSFSDIFRTRRMSQYSESQYFIQDYSQLTNPQTVKLTLTFRFGKFDASLFKRQNTKSQQDGMQGAMDGMQ